MNQLVRISKQVKKQYNKLGSVFSSILDWKISPSNYGIVLFNFDYEFVLHHPKDVYRQIIEWLGKGYLLEITVIDYKTNTEAYFKLDDFINLMLSLKNPPTLQ